jgi:dienelactone hydrolase
VRGLRLVLPLSLALISGGCAHPTQRAYALAAESGFNALELPGNGFRLGAFFKAGPGDYLHVYLEGDGTPWRTRRTVATDPTPRRPVMLRLMALDDAPALYLGRPCYFGHAGDPGCTPALWTERRYSAEVVDSLAAALRFFLGKHRYERLALFGHSGGGALALLLASRFPETFAVATLAGNLDTAAWTAHHRYSPLAGSLNPAGQPATGVPEYHYLGEEDATIPPALFAPIGQGRPGAHVTVVAGFDHGCCWQEIWKAILKQVGATQESRPVPLPRHPDHP